MRLCLIGCGEHARVAHGPAQARCAAERPTLELAACCDLDRERAESHRRDFGFARAYTDAAAMLDAEGPDAVAVVVPIERTCAVAFHVLERGLPLLVEKPPGTTVRELDALVAASEKGGAAVPHLVAFNRRFAPLVRELRRRLDDAPGIQHVHYEMTRVDRRDPDFSVTAVHGIDAVRFIARSDYARVRFRYAPLPELGPGVANVFMDAVMTSGATAHLAFCPVAGVVVERATVHARDESFFLQVPMWAAFDSPGRLQHLREGALVNEVTGDALPDGTALFETGGFHAEYRAFLDALEGGRPPAPGFRESRQSVDVAEHLRRRESEYRA
jgi:myo-inositol 2-dehydrogenase / D-chiro-inositol 1-dehydrogenase